MNDALGSFWKGTCSKSSDSGIPRVGRRRLLKSTLRTAPSMKRKRRSSAATHAKIGSILAEAPGFVFSAVRPAQVNHDLGRLQWHFGPPGASPVVKGMVVALFGHGRIRALYTFIDKPASK
jgi:hypothetical protein